MPRRTTSFDTLIGLLDEAAVPLYLLDEERRIVFCNRALAAWVGASVQDLVGRRVDYHSHGDPSAAPGVALGLCPPPAALRGEATSGHVSCMSADGRLLHRQARFVPLMESASQAGLPGSAVIAFVSTMDVEVAHVEQPFLASMPPDLLHTSIRRFRFEQAQRYELDRLIGANPAVRRARERVLIAASCDACVLILGPKGSGRSHVARAVHYRSDRSRSAHFVPLDCGILTLDVLRQTLDSLGSSTSGSSHDSLLLADIDQMAPDVQVQLAHWYEERASRTRIFATACRPLDALAAEGLFPRELAFSLSALVIDIPPLSQRLEDLPLLAQLLLEEVNRAGGKQIGSLAPDALDMLAGYAWPADVDELAEVIREAHGKAETHEIRAADLPSQLRHSASAARYPRRQEQAIALDDLLKNIESELILRALRQSRGNKTKASRLLGMTRPRLYRRLVQLGLAED